MGTNKIAKALKLQYLLKERGKMTREELARELNIDVRTISKYISDLYDAGIEIVCSTGRNGGCKLYEKSRIIVSTLTDIEVNACVQAENILRESGYVYSDQYSTAIAKIKTLKNSMPLQSHMIYSLGHVKYDAFLSKTNKEYVDVIFRAIEEQIKVRMVYCSTSSGEVERIVHPYQMFEYQGAMYFAGYCELKRKVLYFKIIRIKELDIINEHFENDDEYNIEENMSKSIGLFYGDVYEVELKIKAPMAQVIKEQLIVKGQEVFDCDDDSILFKGELSGLEDIKRWILSLGSCVEIISPEEIKEAIKEEIQKMLINL